MLDKPHGGLGDTRNYGVARATGEYLAFVDSDDWVDPEMLETVYAAAKEHSADLVVFNYMRENLIDGESRACSVPLQASGSDEERNRALLEELIGPSAVSYTHLDVYKRQVWGNDKEDTDLLRDTHKDPQALFAAIADLADEVVLDED